jgi:hydroxymethylglutaryl-CoA lyase
MKCLAKFEKPVYHIMGNHDVKGIYQDGYKSLSGDAALSVYMEDLAMPGNYYYKDPNTVGLVSTEDMVLMMDEMGIETGVDVDMILRLGQLFEKTIGRRLRSNAIHHGRIPKAPNESYKKAGLKARKIKLGEAVK